MVTDEVLTVQEVADYLKVSRTTVWRWCHEGRLPAFKIGRGWRVRRNEVQKLIEEYGRKQDSHGETNTESETSTVTYPL